MVGNDEAKDSQKNRVKENPEFYLTDWEKFQIGKDIIEDKEFGLEKTITGACDRIIRKLMGKMTGCLHRKQDFWMRSLILSRAACKKVRRKNRRS